MEVLIPSPRTTDLRAARIPLTLRGLKERQNKVKLLHPVLVIKNVGTLEKEQFKEIITSQKITVTLYV